MRKPNYRFFSVILSLLMVFSVISFPKLTAKADGIDDFIGRCYQVTLGRDADSDGYAYWRDILVNRKQDGSVVAHGFLFSPEYIDKKTSDEQYIKDLYMLFMGREPEQSGYDYWCEKMANGEDREKIFAGFANSEEYFKLCNGYGITAGYYSADYGIQQINGVNLFVERMYQTSLDRLGDQGGQNDWVQDLLSGRISGIECARCFVQSPEFINKGLSNEAYLKSLYRAFMGREYDQDGLNYWLEKMDNGYTRDEVFAGFANSPEFEGICTNYGIIRGDYTPTDIGNKNNSNNGNNNNENANQNIKVGDVIKLGKYEQDANFENGKEDIEWEVLSVEGNRALLVSQYVLDCKKFTEDWPNAGIRWEDCSLRTWLNNDFYENSFSTEEKTLIPSVSITNTGNSEMGVPDKEDTVDKIFCLSIDEVEKYFGEYNEYDDEYKIGYNINLICAPTQYTIYQCSILNCGNLDYEYVSELDYFTNNVYYERYPRDLIGKEGADWQLRSSVKDYQGEVYNGEILALGRTGGNTQGWYCGVRPAMYMDISNNMIKSEEKEKEQKTYYVDNSEIKYYSLLTIGKYEQDGNLENGKEDIQWEVISVEKDRILLISRYAIDIQPYNISDEEVTWETCSLRKWLNEEFYNNSFDKEEKDRILLVNLENKDNSFCGTKGGNNTDDYVFCLSYNDVEEIYGHDWNTWIKGKPYRDVVDESQLEAPLTDYAIMRGGYYEGYRNIGRWWLRTPGEYTNSALGVFGNHTSERDSWSNVESNCCTIRPAMYIKY